MSDRWEAFKLIFEARLDAASFLRSNAASASRCSGVSSSVIVHRSSIELVTLCPGIESPTSAVLT